MSTCWRKSRRMASSVMWPSMYDSLFGSGRAPATVASCRWVMKQYVIPHLGGVRQQALQPGHFDALYARLLLSASRPGPSGTSTPSSVGRCPPADDRPGRRDGPYSAPAPDRSGRAPSPGGRGLAGQRPSVLRPGRSPATSGAAPSTARPGRLAPRTSGSATSGTPSALT